MNQVLLTSIPVDELVQIFTVIIEEAIIKHNKTEKNKIILEDKFGDHLTKKEVLEVCKIKSPTTLWNWEQKGKLVPKRRAGKKPLYLRQDVEDFLNGGFLDSNQKAA
ncbi:hypothetical protein E1J38_002295 [Seonamhaeicola sediminis]|uniref:Helix-turn-helix domain-containing protein n=1 Tax=Seonamhaeicola sediminis TaxID=2528206 RepID=A0A562YJ41_9FLAO|nr:hypothetical protein [Seonamhaeicola sediminis]TWO34709.1 hypothetical protein E1J38_002295 [Seonamhaeicola sediminis]